MPSKWIYYRFPAIADENEDGSDPTGRKPGELLSPMRSREFLQEIEDRDPQVWLGQFQGRPRDPQGTLIKREWLRTCPASDLPPLDMWVRYWDLATKAANARSSKRGGPDFTAGVLAGVGPDQTLYIRDIVRFRAEWPEACEIIAATTEDDFRLCREAGAEYEVGVEEVAWQRAMIQDLFGLPQFHQVRLTPTPANGDKKERASGWVARARFDKLRMLPGAWNQDFISEALAFDGLGVVHDDQIDGVSGAYGLLWSIRGGTIETKKEPQVGSLAYYRELGKANRAADDSWNYPSYEDDDYDY